MKKSVLLAVLALVLIGCTTKRIANEEDQKKLNDAFDLFNQASALSFNVTRQENVTFKNSDEQEITILESSVSYKNINDFEQFKYANSYNESTNLDFIESFNSSLDLYDNHKLYIDGILEDHEAKNISEVGAYGLYMLKFNKLEQYEMSLKHKGNETVYVFDVKDLPVLPVSYGPYFSLEDGFNAQEFTITIKEGKPKYVALIYSKEDDSQHSIVNISIDFAAYNDFVEVPFTK